MTAVVVMLGRITFIDEIADRLGVADYRFEETDRTTAPCSSGTISNCATMSWGEAFFRKSRSVNQ